MKLSSYKWLKSSALIAGALSFLVSCNKDLPSAIPNLLPSTEGNTITDLLNADDFTILKAAIARAIPASNSGFTPLNTLLSDRTAEFTFFAPVNSAFAPLGITTPAAVAALRTGQLDTLLRYHLVGGQRFLYNAANTSTTFPNFQFPTQLVLQQPSATVPPGLRMSIFPSKRNGMWINNVPVSQADIIAANGVVHKTAAIVFPPSQFLWNRIDTDAGLTYLKAAIKRADEGVAAGSRLEDALLNAAANLTMFAPTDAAFQALLTAQITGALMAQGMDQATAAATAAQLASTPGVFTNAATAPFFSPQTVRGLIVYHVLGNRAFTVNFPTTLTNFPTLLNSGIATHPGVGLQATFGTPSVTTASVKGAANPSASNIQINPTPANNGTSDQHYINGVLHKIDQVLRPQ